MSWTEGRLKSFITSTIRAGFRRYPPKYEALKLAKVGKKVNESSGRLAEHYRCRGCSKDFPASQVQVDHISPAVSPEEGFTTWDSFINNLYCDVSNLQVLCIPCHSKKSSEERKIRKEFKTPERKATYQTWLDMKSRCYNPKSQRFYTHGARGITVCDEWKDSFDTFIKDMGEKPTGLTLDRIDNDGNYCPLNCRWATPKEQANNRSNNISITFNNETKTVSEWSIALGISHSALMKRLCNWSLEDSLTLTKQSLDSIPLEKQEEILKHMVENNLSQTEVAKLYGISQAAVSKWAVKRNKS